MFFDLKEDLVNSSQIFDYCIVGAGAAGITIANELSKAKEKAIALCEAGDIKYTPSSQDCYKGEVQGDHYFPLDVCRLRYFGGSTGHWGGLCRPLDPYDFDRSDISSILKWPINFSEYDKYRSKACNILEISDTFQDIKHSKDIQEIHFEYSPPVRMGEKFYPLFNSSKNLHVFLNAALIDIGGSEGKVKFLTFMSPKKKKVNIYARKFIFAMGGIEIPRYLLYFSKKYGNSFFSANLPIGHYWMEHPTNHMGEGLINRKVTHKKRVFFALNEDKLKKYGLLNCSLATSRQNSKGIAPVLENLLCEAPSVGKKFANLFSKNLLCGIKIRYAQEQMPVYSNKINLSDKTDELGIPRSILNWKVSDYDYQTLLQNFNSFNYWLMKNNLGRVKLYDWALNNSPPPRNDEIGGNHHMGGTRMSSSPSFGVVDSNCKVHGSNNIYIAGSSIFPSGGHANPTLSIIQLSLRLADHLRKIDV